MHTQRARQQPTESSAANQVIAPADTEPLARTVINFLGGPIGPAGRINRSRWWNPVSVIVSVAWVFCAFGFLSKANCAQGAPADELGAPATLNWSGNRQYVSACYNDIVPLFRGRGFDEGGFPYAFSWNEDGVTRFLEYPVLTGMFQGLMGWIARSSYWLVDNLGSLNIPMAGWYFALSALVLSFIWVLTIRLACSLAGRRVWDIILVAASPLVIVHAFTNWDILAIFFAVVALYFVAGRHPLFAGIAIGLGTATKLWPLFLLGAFAVLALRRKRFGSLLVMVISAGVSWLIVNLPVMIAYPDAFSEFQRLNRERSWEWTTIYAVVARNTPFNGFDPSEATPQILNAVSLGLFIACCSAIAIFGWRVRREPRVAELVFLIVAAFLLVNKVWSPQYSLWLVIPAVLALPRWRLLLTWMIVDMCVWPVLMWHMLGSDNQGLPPEFLDIVICLRTGLIIVMAVCVIRQMLGKTTDKVAAAHGGRDPLAGPFEAAETSGQGKNS